jgi:hypothetical protein
MPTGANYKVEKWSPDVLRVEMLPYCRQQPRQGAPHLRAHHQGRASG